MDFIIDIVLFIIFAIFVIIGWKKGFFKSFMDLTSKIIAVVIARALGARLAPEIYSKYFEASAENSLVKYLDTAGASVTQQVQNALDSIPDKFSGFFELVGFDKQSAVTAVSMQINDSGSNLSTVLMSNVVSPVLTAIIRVLLFVAIFVVAVFVLKIVTKLLNKLSELPFFKQANSLFGLVFGAAEGIIVIGVICFIIKIFAGFIDNESFTTLVLNSRLVGLFELLLAA